MNTNNNNNNNSNKMSLLWWNTTMFLLSIIVLLQQPLETNAKAILGIDLGSNFMKVALVQRSAPLEIVTNMHSKRKTEQMVMFDRGTRLYGADAKALLARKPQVTPTHMSVMLGRSDQHTNVQVLTERHNPIKPYYNETRHGLAMEVVKDSLTFTPEELVAMVLEHAKLFTTAFGVAETSIKDCVLTVPAFATQLERKALLDAAAMADFNVLALLEENTAAALHFGIDRIDDEPYTVVFYNMGASGLQVSVVKFHSYDHKDSKFGKSRKVGGFEVLGKAWDSTLGGNAFDQRIVQFLADSFNAKWSQHPEKDVRNYAKPMMKMRMEANKIKHVLSANNEMPIYMDSVHDDISLQTSLSRTQLKELCKDLLDRAAAPITSALQHANVTLAEVDAIELIGGGMRVPLVQDEIKKALAAEESKLVLGMHINSDESMALGAAFHGANISTAFKVRQVGLTDMSPFAIQISLSNMAVMTEGGLFGIGKKEEVPEETPGEEPWGKKATVFKTSTKLGVKKTIAFTHDKDVTCAVSYQESDLLPEGTEMSLENYNISGVAKFAKEMSDKGLGKPKVSLQFELSSSGITKLTKAEAAVEEIIMVEEEVEVNATETNETEDAAADDAADANAAANADNETAPATDEEATANATTEDNATATTNETKKEDEKKQKKKTIKVEREKKKVHKRALDVTIFSVGKIRPTTPELLEESKSKLQYLTLKDKERLMLEEARNKVESYIYHIKGKMNDEEDINKVSTEEQREAVITLANDAEDWLYGDGYSADLPTTEAKYTELSTPGEAILFRLKELTARPAAFSALRQKLTKIEDLMTKWETTMPQVSAEERTEVLGHVEDIRKWISDKEEAQGALAPHEDPVVVSAEIPTQTKRIESLVSRLSRKPKPKPVVNETKTTSSNSTDGNETETTTATEEEKKEEAKEEGEETTTTTDAKEEGEEKKEEAKEEATEEEGNKEATTDEEKIGEEL